MPIYEYNCPGCGKPFQKRVGFAEADERQECPHCGNKHGRRQLSLIANTRSSDGGGAASSAPVFRAPT